MTDRDDDSGSRALIRWISGPVLRARADGPFLLREAIRVGPAGLLGEVIRLNEDEIVAQVYEDTTGLRPGVEVHGTGNLLGIRVGPGLLGNIYDGLLRPLQPAGAMRFRFEPAVQAGAELGLGAPFGAVSPPRGRQQRALMPPNVAGRVAWIADAGEVTDDATVLREQIPQPLEHRQRERGRGRGADRGAGRGGAKTSEANSRIWGVIL